MCSWIFLMIWFIFFCIYDSEIASQFNELAGLSAVFFHSDRHSSLNDSFILIRLLIFPHHVAITRLSGLPTTIENVLHVVHVGLIFLKWVLRLALLRETLSYLFCTIAGHKHLSHVTNHGRTALWPMIYASLATTNDLFDVRVAV